uniref:Uncharacterized protein n=1 Tax=Solanum lycopersicum TaxID=4081 RepID=A0A3Q7IE94_SOLLC
ARLVGDEQVRIASTKIDGIGPKKAIHRGERADIKLLVLISCFLGIRHQDGSPLHGQQTHTNTRTCCKLIQKCKKSTKIPWYLSDQSH